MLGDIVDIQFQKEAGDAVANGEIIGSIEGFKAISDIYCVADGRFATLNPVVRENAALIAEAPYADGWLYEFEGEPDPRCADVDSYRALLDATIDRMLAKQQGAEEQT